MKKIIKDGFVNVALSRNTFDNDIQQYEDNETKLPGEKTLDYHHLCLPLGFIVEF